VSAVGTTGAAAPPRLELAEVSKRFGGLEAVRRLSFQARRGEILGLIGPNGAGKSTVLGLIGGQQRVSAGRIFLDGRRLDRLPQWRRVRVGVAHSPQHAVNLDRATVRENVLLGLGAHGLRSAAGGWLRFVLGDAAVPGPSERRCLDLLDRVGLGARAQHPVSTLSHWEKRLLGLARVLAADPVLVLFDEPFAGLGARETEQLIGIIRRLRTDEGKTFVVTEHNVDAVLRLSDRVVALHFGEQIACDVPERIVKNEKVVEVYLGTAS
jgi:ABC-type branched-subunit amino acid transport system ATPase component